MSRFENFLTSTLSCAGFLIMAEPNQSHNEQSPSANVGPELYYGFMPESSLAFNTFAAIWPGLGRWRRLVYSY